MTRHLLLAIAVFIVVVIVAVIPQADAARGRQGREKLRHKGRRHHTRPGLERADRIRRSYEDEVIHRIVKRYKQRGLYARPVTNFNETLQVNFSIQLIQIMDLNEQDQIISLNVWDTYWWRDELIVWNETEFGGVSAVRIPSDKLWLPDIKLYNYADLRLEEHRDALCTVYSNGNIQWLPQVVYRSSCPLHVYLFPFDVQNCTLKFGSWTYDGSKVDVNFHANMSYIDLSDYQESLNWEILDVPAVRNVHYYTCCPEPFIDLTYMLIFQRKSTLYCYILLLPCVLLTSIVLILFFIPNESPAKMQLGMSIFICFFILLRILEKNLPPGVQTMPLLATYYCMNMVLITVSAFCNVLVVNIQTSGTRAPPVSRLVRKVMFDVIARVLFLEDLVRPLRHAKTLSPTQQLAGPSVPEEVAAANDSKWSTDPMASTEVLLQLKREQLSQGGGGGLLAAIDAKLCELRDFLRQHRERVVERDRKELTAKEWRAMAIILDRVIFYIYLLTIVISICTVFPILTYRKHFVPSKLHVTLGETA